MLKASGPELEGPDCRGPRPKMGDPALRAAGPRNQPARGPRMAANFARLPELQGKGASRLNRTALQCGEPVRACGDG